MTPNPTSAKAKLFALYLGQKVYCQDNLDGNPHSLFPVDFSVDSLINTGYLLLRIIGSLTEFECLKVAKLVYGSQWNDKEFLGIIVPNAENIHDDIIDSQALWAIQDYLRSISVALPFTVLEDGKPRTYSVEEMVELNWITVNEK